MIGTFVRCTDMIFCKMKIGQFSHCILRGNWGNESLLDWKITEFASHLRVKLKNHPWDFCLLTYPPYLNPGHTIGCNAQGFFIPVHTGCFKINVVKLTSHPHFRELHTVQKCRSLCFYSATDYNRGKISLGLRQYLRSDTEQNWRS